MSYRCVAIVLLLSCGSPSETESDAGIAVEEVASLGEADLPTLAMDVAISGTTVYAVGINELLVLDISDPANPTTQTNAIWGGNGIFLDDTTLFVTHSGSDDVVVRQSDAATLCRTDDECTDYSLGGRAAGRLAVLDSSVFVTSSNGVLIVDTEEVPAYRATVSSPDVAWDVAARGSWVAVAADAAGVAIIDMSKFPKSTSQTLIAPAPNEVAWAVFFISDSVLLIGMSDALVTVDVTETSELGRFALSGAIFAADSTHAYVIGEACSETETPADGGVEAAGFHVVDLADPTHMTELACRAIPPAVAPLDRNTPVAGRGLAVADSRAALAVDDKVYFFSVPTEK